MCTHTRGYNLNNSPLTLFFFKKKDVRNWFSNIEQHASEGVNKILIGNKCDVEDKRVSVNINACKKVLTKF